MAGKVTVGTVYLKVQPDLDGFRRKVEQGAKGLKDVELDVNPDMDGFRQKVKAATKGMKATVDVDANTSGLIRKTQKALDDVRRKAKNTARMTLEAEFAHASADRRIQRFMKKVNATNVIKLKVAGLNPSDVSSVRDQVEQAVSRKPVKLRFAAPKAQIKEALENVQRTLRKQIPGQQRYMQLALGTSPKDSGSQRKMLSYLDQVRSKIDKLKKPVASPWEQWDGKRQLKTFNTDLGSLSRELSKLKKLDHDSWKIGQVGVSRDKDSLPKLTRQLYEAGQAHRELVKRSQDTGEMFPGGFRKLTRDIERLSKELGGAKKQFGDISPKIQQFTKDMDSLVKKRTRREIITAKIVDTKTFQETQKQLGKLREGFDKTAARVSRTNEKLQQKIREASYRTETVVRKTQERIKRAASPIARQISLARSIDPGNKIDKSLSGQLANLLQRAKGAAKGLDGFRDSARGASGASRELASENARAASSFKRVETAAKKARNTGFGGKRRKGLKTIDEVGTERFAGLSRIGWIVAAIGAVAAPVVQLISGLAAALPALGGAALAALGVTLLGLDGIKEAAKAAEPALERAKEAVSGIFETRMTPQFKQLGKLLDDITPQLETMAHGMADFSQGLTDGLTSTTGTGNIQKILTNSADLFSKMKPFAKDFTEGLLEMAGAGSETFPELAKGMNRFGDSFKKNISELATSGELQAAIQATYDVIGNLGMNLGKILRAGIESAPSMSASLEPLLDGLTDGILDLMPLLSSFAEFVGPTLGTALSSLGDLAAAATPGLTSLFEGLTPGLSDFISGAANLGSIPLGVLSSFLGGLGPGMGDTLSMVGTGFSNLADGINDVAGANVEGTIGSLEEATGSLGTAWGSILPGLLGQYNDVVDELEAPDPDDYSGFLGAVSFFYDDYSYSIKKGTKQISDALAESGRERRQAMVDSFADETQGMLQPLTAFKETLKQSAKMAAAQLKVDIKPELELLSDASTDADVEKIQEQIAEKLRNGLSRMESDVEITIDPKIDLQGAFDNLGSSLDGPLEDLQTGIAQFQIDAEAIAGEVGIDIAPQIRVLQDATNEAEFTASAQEIINSLQDAIGITPTEIDPNLTLSQTSPVDTTGVADGVKDQVETDINAALTGLDLDMGGAATEIGSQLGDALGGVHVPMEGLTDQVTSQIDNMVSGVGDSIAGITDIMISEGANAQAGFVGAMEATSSESVGIAEGMASSIQATLSMDLTENGASVGQTFADGLLSKVEKVREAAAALAGAVGSNMPQSPAKEGPLSGSGWVDTSGIAVGREFAAGMLSQVGVVGNAAGQVTGAVRDEFDKFQANPVSNMESFKRNEVLQPVLESNAKKIADWRKREEERAEKHNERMGKIDEGKSKADKKEEQRVKARESLAKQSAESYEKLLESLETPDYESIDRSFQGYWMDGYSDALRQSIQDAMSSTNVSGALAKSVKETTALIRDNIGDFPILAQVEANVDSEAFSWAVHNAIEEAGIHEVPINFAVANIDQLKSDLGMGDGVMSRALDQAIQFDPARNDMRRYEEEKPEVHYHVTDMEEAIRLEHKRERLELMRLPR